ncbi:MAG: FAD-dependent oxidoreductase [Candidatus Edwardsbacteria bacterium]|jgi:alkyl hydroperoxide reductase subunit F|nr:FAD-dependent oxidoreductase [Candidatus Edwardsbacteria bacterium]
MELTSLNLSLDALRQTDFPAVAPGGWYDLAIVGGGPAGLTAGIYAARKRVPAVMVTHDLGGQVLWTSSVENYPGYNLVQGRDLVEKFKAQVAQFPIAVAQGQRVARIEPQRGRFRIVTESDVEHFAKAVVLATGKRYRSLGVPGEKELIGRGVAYCATCDAPLFQGKVAAVVGGGNSALTSAGDLLKYAARVYVISNMAALTGDAVLQEPLRKSDKVEFLMNTTVLEIHGTDKVESITFSNNANNQQQTTNVAGVFVEIGLIPNSEPFQDLVDLNQRGEIVVDCACRTSRPGVFAAGDVTTVPAKQIVVAAGEGAKAALSAFDWLARGGPPPAAGG